MRNNRIYISILFMFVLFSKTYSQDLAINEFVSSNDTTIADENGDFEDWIEIYNYGTTSINLNGFGLSDQIDNPFKWVFPNITLGAKEYILIWASDKNRSNENGELHTNFKLKSGGEAILLSNRNGNKIDESPAVALATDTSYGRNPDGTGNWATYTTPTPNDSNTGATSAEPEKVAINEFLSSNTDDITDSDGDYEDWIELYNYGNQVVNLNGFGLTDDSELPYKWVFPNVSIQPGAYIIVWASSKDRTNTSEELHTNFKISASGENIRLTNNNGLLVSGSPSVSLDGNTSLGRQPNGTGSWLFFDNPTPRASNQGSGTTTSLEPPVFSHNSGLYTNEFNLTLSTDVQNASIIYTLDGSEPDINNLGGSTFQYKNDYPFDVGEAEGPLLNAPYTSMQYTSPITIKDRSNEEGVVTIKNTWQDDLYVPENEVRKATVIKAKVFLNNKASETKSRTFFVWSQGNTYNMPIVSINTYEGHLFDYNDGIYTAGVDFDDWRRQNPSNNQAYRPEFNNYWRSGRDHEFKASIELFNANGLASVENLNGGFRIHGNNSRGDRVKNLRLYARDEYDENDRFNHNLFQQKIPGARINDRFKRILLRGNGSGGQIAYDVVMNRMMQPVYNGVMRIEPAVHFINGEFFGLTALRDRIDQFHFDYNFDVDRDILAIIDIKSGKIELDYGVDGDRDEFEAFVDFVTSNDMSNDSNYNNVKENLLDVDSFIDHLIMEVFAENDSYELKFWKSRTIESGNEYTDGKYRVTVQDFEASLGGNRDINWLEEYTEDKGNGNYRSLAIRLLDNEEFKIKFINRFADLLNSVLSEDRFVSVVNQTFNEVAPILDEDENRDPDRARFYRNRDKDNLLDWIEPRINEARDELTNKFNLSNTINLNVNLSSPNAGFVKLNTIELKSSTPGVQENPYPWSGIYFRDIPITLTAEEYPGYTFSNWSGANNSSQKTITITPNGTVNLTANYNVDTDFSHLIYFWYFNNDLENDVPFQQIAPSYSRSYTDASLHFESSLNGYPFNQNHPDWRKGSLERVNKPTNINYQELGNNGLEYNSNEMRGIQVKQPFQTSSGENTIFLELNTTTFEDIKLAFAIESNGAANAINIDYWNGNNYTSNGIQNQFDITNSFERIEVDFTNVSLANNNSNFKIRIRFDGANMTAEDGKTVVFNNIAIFGIDTTLSTDDDFKIPQNFTTIYPNPASNSLVVKSEKIIDKVEVFNLIGQKVFQKNTEAYKSSLDISSLKEGVYILKVYAEGLVTSKKLVKN